MFRKVALAVVVIASEASADTAVIAVGKCDHSAIPGWTRSVREALAQAPELNVLSEEDTVTRLGGVPRGSLADAERLLAAARMDVFQDDLGRAERVTRGAIEDLQRLPPSEERWKDLADAWVLLAQIHVKSGRKDAARGAFLNVLRVDPAYIPNPDLYPPSLRDLADEVREAAKAERRVPLRISTRPRPLQLYVDGRAVGTGSVSLSLPRGEYVIEADFGARRGLPRRIRLGEPAIVEIEEGFEGSVTLATGPCLEAPRSREERLAALVRIGTMLESERVIAVRDEELAPGERYLIASTINTSTGEETREGRVRLYAAGTGPGALERLASFLATGEAQPPVQAVLDEVLRPDAPIAANEPEPTIEPSPQKQDEPVPLALEVKPTPRPTRSRWPATTTGGAAAALGAAGGWFLWQSNQTNRSLEGLRSDGSFPAGSEADVARMNQSLATERSLALGFGIASSLALSATLYFLFSAPGESP